jgi:hypothetical protein
LQRFLLLFLFTLLLEFGEAGFFFLTFTLCVLTFLFCRQLFLTFLFQFCEALLFRGSLFLALLGFRLTLFLFCRFFFI